MMRRRFILGSRSPRRLELLRKIVPADRIDVLPPRVPEEAGFDGLHQWQEVERQLLDIARGKCDDVLEQLRRRPPERGDAEVAAVITADTIVVVEDSTGRPVVLGQPPEGESWVETVRHWFHAYYFGRTHRAATAFCVAVPGRHGPARRDGPVLQRVVTSEVTFHADGQRWLDWYLSTGEPCGKAGGYAIQEAGGIFVSRLEGSLTNVIGLPLRELFEAFEELGLR